MRITLHAVHVDDYPTFHNAMVAALRASRLGDRRFTQTGLSAEELDQFLPELLRYTAQPRTNAEVEALLAERFGALPKAGGWWAARTFARWCMHPSADCGRSAPGRHT